jgi:parallel beta-helix repeat protein
MERTLARLGTIGLLALLAGATLVGPAAAHHAPAPAPDTTACSQVVRANLTLTHDVGPCATDGLVVGADGITINLNGKSILGRCADGVTGNASGAGILLQGISGVTINGPGTISCFSGGVEIQALKRAYDQVVTPTSVPATGTATVSAVIPADNNKVLGLTIRDNATGDASDWGEGIGLWGASNNTVQNNTVVHNGPYAGIGLYDVSNGNKILNNTVTDNNLQRSATINEDMGIRLEPQTNKNLVQYNTVTNSGLDGISLLAGPAPFTNNNEIKDNTVKANGFHNKAHRKGNGIVIFGFSVASNGVTNTVSGNTVCANAASGIRVDGGDKDNTVAARRNIISGNTSGTGTGCSPNATAPVPAGQPLTYDLYDKNGNCTANTWSGNTYGTKDPPCIS